MSSDYNASLATPQPAPLGAIRTWTLALAPSEQNYTQIAADPNASAGRAYLWMFIAFLIGGFISSLISFGVNTIMGPSANPILQSLGVPPPAPSSIFVTILCGVPLLAIFGLIGVTISTALVQFLATALGGKGTFTQLLYAYSAYFVPLFLINSLISNIPCVGLLAILTGIYAIVLNVVATKAVHQLGWGQALLATLVIPAVILVLLACVVIGGLALLGPAIGNVFSGIVNNI